MLILELECSGQPRCSDIGTAHVIEINQVRPLNVLAIVLNNKAH